MDTGAARSPAAGTPGPGPGPSIQQRAGDDPAAPRGRHGIQAGTVRKRAEPPAPAPAPPHANGRANRTIFRGAVRMEPKSRLAHEVLGAEPTEALLVGKIDACMLVGVQPSVATLYVACRKEW